MSSRRNRELTRTTLISILFVVNFVSQYKYRKDKSTFVSDIFVLQMCGDGQKINVNKVDICDIRKEMFVFLKGANGVYFSHEILEKMMQKNIPLYIPSATVE